PAENAAAPLPMTPLMNARLETSACVSVASLLLMSSSMAAGSMDWQPPRQGARSGVAPYRAIFRGYARVRPAARCEPMYADKQGCIYARTRQIRVTVIPTAGATGGRGVRLASGDTDATNSRFGYQPSDNRCGGGARSVPWNKDPTSSELQNQLEVMRSRA